MTANELADELTKMFRGEEYDRLIHEIPDMLRQQAQEIEDLKNANRFIQNFAEEQHQRAVALEAEIEELKPYKEKIEMMERAYDAHIKKSMGEVKDLIKKASEK